MPSISRKKISLAYQTSTLISTLLVYGFYKKLFDRFQQSSFNFNRSAANHTIGASEFRPPPSTARTVRMDSVVQRRDEVSWGGLHFSKQRGLIVVTYPEFENIIFEFLRKGDNEIICKASA